MNLNASPDTVRNVAEALKMAAILDDRIAQADKARIAAWAEKVETRNLTRDDLLEGLQDFYDRPSDRPIGIGDLIHLARIRKRSRLDREADAEREERQAAHDVKAADMLGSVVIGPTGERTPALDAATRGLDFCHGRDESRAAISEYLAARKPKARP